MRRIAGNARSLPFALLLALAAIASPASEVAGTLLRTTLIVEDMQRSLDFYATLGFKPAQEISGPRSPDSPFPVNARSRESRLIILASATQQGSTIALLTFAKPAPRWTRRRERRVGIGDMVFVIGVEDARAIHADLHAAGIKTVEEPFSFISRTRTSDGREQQGWVFHLYDPDGYLIEIFQPPRPIGD
ncbi:MAG: VOC family protein [Steroidobacteraceae bacterium]